MTREQARKHTYLTLSRGKESGSCTRDWYILTGTTSALYSPVQLASKLSRTARMLSIMNIGNPRCSQIPKGNQYRRLHEKGRSTVAGGIWYGREFREEIKIKLIPSWWRLTTPTIEVITLSLRAIIRSPSCSWLSCPQLGLLSIFPLWSSCYNNSKVISFMYKHHCLLYPASPLRVCLVSNDVEKGIQEKKKRSLGPK